MCFFQVANPAKRFIAGLAIRSRTVADVVPLAFMDGLYVFFQAGRQAKRFIAGLAIRSRTVADVVPLAFMDGLYVSFQAGQPGQTLYCRAGHPLQERSQTCSFL